MTLLQAMIKELLLLLLLPLLTKKDSDSWKKKDHEMTYGKVLST
jgi:hypothetical protein